MLAQLFVFISDYQNNIRAVYELPDKDTVVVSLYEYYTMERASQQMDESSLVDSIGRVYMSTVTYNNMKCNLAIYDDAITNHYLPELQAGQWLSDTRLPDETILPTVVSGDVGLKLGDTIDLPLPTGVISHLKVTGILKTPTQYLYPAGWASPKYFSSKMVINQQPVFIISKTPSIDASRLESPLGQPAAKNLFVFLNDDAQAADIETAMRSWRKYGETTLMASLIEYYIQETNTLIYGGLSMFLVFLSLAATTVLNNCLTQSMFNQRLFTIYYLVGMDWKKGAVIEILRIAIIITTIIALSVIAGASGLLMLQWMTRRQALMFYGVVLVYLLSLFIAIGAWFLIKLVRTDIAVSLKELQHGE
jgi:hypothetical protein